MRNNSQNRNVKLVIVESALTASLLAAPIMTPFYLNIGLNQEQIALSQMAFTAVELTLNVPLGWLADRFSRKWANVLGDLCVAIGHLLYSTAQTLWFVVLCEVICGIGFALSQGVDSSLLKHFTEKTDASGETFKNKFGLMISCQQIASIITLLLGGPIGAISFRLAIALSAVPPLIGAVISCFIQDDSEKLAAEGNPIHDIIMLVRRNLKNSKLRIRIFAYAVARKATHGIIWVFTPLMMAVGVPLAIVSLGWVINSCASYLGSKLARRYAKKLTDWQLFATPIALACVACMIMFCNLNIFTITLFACLGIAQGWSATTLMPLIKERVKAAEQSSVESLARMVSQLIYIGAVWVVNRAADINLSYALLATVLIFAPLSIPIALRLRD